MPDPICTRIDRAPRFDMPVLPVLPIGAFVSRPWLPFHDLDHRPIRDERGVLLGANDPYHHCRLCDGFIEGYPQESRVDNMGILCGRKGVEFCCQRCGYVLHFDGMTA